MAISSQQFTIASGTLYLLYFLLPDDYSIATIGIGLAIILLTILHLSRIIHFFDPSLDGLERLSLAIPTFFISFPSLIYIIYALTDTLHQTIPITLSGLIVIASIGLGIWQKEHEQ